MSDIITFISRFRIPIYVLGDFNINILNHFEKNAQDLVNMFHSYSLFSTINKPTRATHHSATIIDHIWTNNTDNYLTSEIIYNSISDHFPISSSFSIVNNNNAINTVTFTSRKFTNEEINAFKADLLNFDWNMIALNNDVNDLFNKQR